MSRAKSPEEMQAIQEADAKLQEKQRAEFVPEKNEAIPIAYFEIDRYVKGPFKGLFVVSQMIVDDGKGKSLKKPIRKIVAEGVDMVVAMSQLETALRRKVFK